MYTRKRGDTHIESIERTYRIDLRARGDMKLDNILAERGFDSLSQLLDAYHGRLTVPARRRRVFLSFHAEDSQQVAGFRLMPHNRHLDFDLVDGSLKVPVNSENRGYVKQVLRPMIQRCSVVICLIGNGTAWRDWVDWELDVGREMGKGLCGVRLKGSRGRTPPLLRELGAPVAGWDMGEIVAAIECAAARRS